jgi:hypothetical protein
VPDITDRNVFVLGAGFSADAGAPLIHDFLQVSRELLDDPGSELDNEEKRQFQLVFDFKKRVAQCREKFRIDLDNIEQLFGLVEMSHRLGSESATTRDATVYLIAKTLQLAVARQQHRRLKVGLYPQKSYAVGGLTWTSFGTKDPTSEIYFCELYRHFALLLAGKYDDPQKVQHRSNMVITFNYDLILDDAFRGINVAPLYALPDALLEEPIPSESSGILLLKLHGSTNWAICGRCQKVHILEAKVTEDAKGFRRKPCARCGVEGLRLLLVPPSWDKSEYQEVMKPVWRRALEALQQATRICVIGYSMPETDAFFKFLLALGLAENHQLYRFLLVDLARARAEVDSFQPRNEPGSQTVDARYRDMLETIFVERRFQFYSRGFADFLLSGTNAMARAETIGTQGLY